MTIWQFDLADHKLNLRFWFWYMFELWRQQRPGLSFVKIPMSAGTFLHGSYGPFTNWFFCKKMLKITLYKNVWGIKIMLKGSWNWILTFWPQRLFTKILISPIFSTNFSQYENEKNYLLIQDSFFFSACQLKRKS